MDAEEAERAALREENARLLRVAALQAELAALQAARQRAPQPAAAPAPDVAPAPRVPPAPRVAAAPAADVAPAPRVAAAPPHPLAPAAAALPLAHAAAALPLAHAAAAPRDAAAETEAEACEAVARSARGVCAVTALRTGRGSALVGAWDFLYLPRWPLRRQAGGARDGCGRVELKASKVGADGYVQFSCKQGTFFTKAPACDMVIFAFLCRVWWFAVVPFATVPLQSPLGLVLGKNHFRAKPAALIEGRYVRGLRFVRGESPTGIASALCERQRMAAADCENLRAYLVAQHEQMFGGSVIGLGL